MHIEAETIPEESVRNHVHASASFVLKPLKNYLENTVLKLVKTNVRIVKNTKFSRAHPYQNFWRITYQRFALEMRNVSPLDPRLEGRVQKVLLHVW